MSNFTLAPGETLMQCPYEKSHQIINFRFETHLSKCRANHIKDCKKKGKPVEFGVCRYNYIHQVNKIELEHHEEHCTDRYNIVPHIQYHQSDEFKAKLAAERCSTSVANANTASNGGQICGNVSNVTDQLSTLTLTPPATPDDGGENWDADADDSYVAGYDPKQKLANGVFLVMPSGLKPAERKAFRKENIRKAREQAEREETEKYGPRIGSAEQPHWRQASGSPAAAPGTIRATPAPGPSVSLPVGLTLADVMGGQSGQAGGKKKKKKKKKAQANVPKADEGNQASMPVRRDMAAVADTVSKQEGTKEPEGGSDYDWDG